MFFLGEKIIGCQDKQSKPISVVNKSSSSVVLHSENKEKKTNEEKTSGMDEVFLLN